MILVIDTSHHGEISVAVSTNGRLRTVRHRFDTPGSGQLLNIIDRLLKHSKIQVRELTGIVIASGPGPFSALRASAAIANAFGYALSIPVVGVRGEHTLRQLAEQGRRKLLCMKSGAVVVPFYGRRPNITKRKR